MVNYTYVWPSALANAPQVASHMGWARWPALEQGNPSRVTIGGINLGVSAHARHPDLVFEAAACIASESNQRIAARLGGLPPTTAALYEDPEVRRTFPFADIPEGHPGGRGAATPEPPLQRHLHRHCAHPAPHGGHRS